MKNNFSLVTTCSFKSISSLFWLVGLVISIVVVSSCGDGETSYTDDTDTDNVDTVQDAQEGDSSDLVVQGRADWSTGYFQSYIYKQLLEELDYEVTEPADKEQGPSLAYLSMADGVVDFWANSWYPLHNSWLEPELPDGSKVGDHLTVVGNEMLNGGLQGLLVTASFANKYGITHLDQINNNPEILAAYDATDNEPGNGKAEIFGCPESWTCDDVIDSQIAFSGWDNIVHVKAGYDAMFADATQKIKNDEPVVIYTWAPSHYLSELRPGDNVVWLAVENVLDDSNPLGVEGGEGLDQRPGIAAIPAEQCPAAATDGACQMGWTGANIQVTANTDWLNANPQAAELLCAVELPALDVTLALVETANSGDESEQFVADLASKWISNNRDKVDSWLERARNAPATPSCPETVLS